MRLFLSAALAATLLSSGLMLKAQAPASAPAGSTGLCNDGTYSQNATKSGACRGHKGVKTWYTVATAPATKPAVTTSPVAASSKPAAAVPVAPVATKPVTTTATPVAAKPVSTSPAPGGGPGMVWVNTSTKVYHCSGTRFYGTTKQGSYMSEADAKAKGFHADANKPCTK
jgi:hypothetical protein